MYSFESIQFSFVVKKINFLLDESMLLLSRARMVWPCMGSNNSNWLMRRQANKSATFFLSGALVH